MSYNYNYTSFILLGSYTFKLHILGYSHPDKLYKNETQRDSTTWQITMWLLLYS